MDAIALLMFAEPAVIPSPRSETALADAPFGALVALAANSKEQDVGDSTATPSDMATTQASLMSAIVSQWLAQRDSAPSLPTLARGILEARPSVVPEAAVSQDAAETPASPLEGLPPTEASEQVPETVEQVVSTTGRTTTANPDRMASDNASPDEGSTPGAHRAQNEEPRIPIQLLMQHAVDIGWNVPSSETRPASAELKIPTPSEPVEDAVANLQTPPPDTRANVRVSQQAVESRVNRAVESAMAEASIPDEAKVPNLGEPKTAAVADRANVAKQSVAPHASAHTPESLQSPPSAPASAASTPLPAADNISIPPPTNMSAAEISTDIPVKLAAVTREGQTAEMQTLALHIAARWAKGESRFTIRLDPPELGRIDVNLNVNSHGHAQAVLAVEKPQTLDLLLRDAPTLERALKDAGLELGSNLSFSLKEEGRQNYAHGDQYSPPSHTVELVQTEAAKPHVALSASLVEQLYGSRMARLDITV